MTRLAALLALGLAILCPANLRAQAPEKGADLTDLVITNNGNRKVGIYFIASDGDAIDLAAFGKRLNYRAPLNGELAPKGSIRFGAQEKTKFGVWIDDRYIAFFEVSDNKGVPHEVSLGDSRIEERWGKNASRGSIYEDNWSFSGGAAGTTGKPAADNAGKPAAGNAGSTLTAEEAALVKRINDYRAANGLPAIPASKKLTLVAQTHVKDMAKMMRMTHDWSQSDKWTGGSINDSWNIMWDKPKEIAGYPSRGYENAAGGGGQMTAAQALDMWKGDAPHRDVILNQGIWKNSTWKALGVGIYNGYACMWVGELADAD